MAKPGIKKAADPTKLLELYDLMAAQVPLFPRELTPEAARVLERLAERGEFLDQFRLPAENSIAVDSERHLSFSTIYCDNVDDYTAFKTNVRGYAEPIGIFSLSRLQEYLNNLNEELGQSGERQSLVAISHFNSRGRKIPDTMELYRKG